VRIIQAKDYVHHLYIVSAYRLFYPEALISPHGWVAANEDLMALQMDIIRESLKVA